MNKNAKKSRTGRSHTRRPRDIRTLAVDIGGTGTKALILDGRGRPLTLRSRIKTPADAAPGVMLKAIRRLARVIEALDQLFNYDNLYIGGGNSDKVTLRLPSGVRAVSNINGLLGGIALWE